MIPDIANAGIDIATKIVSYTSDAVLAIVISIYTLLSKDLLISQAKKVIYALFNKRYADNTIALTRESNEIFGAYISNVLLEALIIGCLHFLVLTICRVPYAPLISVIIGITDIIPYIGPVIGAAISTLLLFVVSPAYALTLLIVTICIQQLEAHLIAPKILGESTGLTKFWVVSQSCWAAACLAPGYYPGNSPICSALFGFAAIHLFPLKKAKSLRSI